MVVIAYVLLKAPSTPSAHIVKPEYYDGPVPLQTSVVVEYNHIPKSRYLWVVVRIIRNRVRKCSGQQKKNRKVYARRLVRTPKKAGGSEHMKDKPIRKAVALKYDQAKELAPKVVAKGKGLVAEKIIQVARDNDVLLHEDSNLANVLEVLEMESEIPEALYRAVAEVLVFLYRINHDYQTNS